MKITEVKELKLAEKIELLADEIWYEHYKGILSEGQIAYMLAKYQSALAIMKQIDNGFRYFLVTFDETTNAGYFAIKYEGSKLFISKSYLKKEHRGKGLFTGMLDFITEYAHDRNVQKLYLKVHKQNTESIAIYFQKGFKIDGEELTEIGSDYVLDDYIMTKQV